MTIKDVRAAVDGLTQKEQLDIIAREMGKKGNTKKYLDELSVLLDEVLLTQESEFDPNTDGEWEAGNRR